MPDHVEKGCTGDEDAFDAHALEVVEAGGETLDVATKAELGLAVVMFPEVLENLVVGGVAVGELV